MGFTPEMLALPIASISGGWKMKLALARAMLLKADILLLDEVGGLERFLSLSFCLSVSVLRRGVAHWLKGGSCVSCVAACHCDCTWGKLRGNACDWLALGRATLLKEGRHPSAEATADAARCGDLQAKPMPLCSATCSLPGLQCSSTNFLAKSHAALLAPIHSLTHPPPSRIPQRSPPTTWT